VIIAATGKGGRLARRIALLRISGGFGTVRPILHYAISVQVSWILSTVNEFPQGTCAAVVASQSPTYRPETSQYACADRAVHRTLYVNSRIVGMRAVASVPNKDQCAS
jgi:hypothetical protein